MEFIDAPEPKFELMIDQVPLEVEQVIIVSESISW